LLFGRMKSEKKQRPFKGKLKRDKAIEQKHNFRGSEKPWLDRKMLKNCFEHSLHYTLSHQRKVFVLKN